MERALRAEKLVTGAIRITNRGGAGGTIGLAEFARARGDGRSLVVMGLVMVGAVPVSSPRSRARAILSRSITRG